PSQRLPRAQRDNAWHRVRQAVGTGGAPQPAPAPPHTDVYEHPPPDCPPEFVDSVTHCLMRDPVFLPSTARCDRSTIDRHLREHSTDPFTGLPLDASQVKPDLVLQQRIRSWLASRATGNAAPGKLSLMISPSDPAP
ncbi:hypothetical protein H4R21_000324, partial [Coemansia helicoidea]